MFFKVSKVVINGKREGKRVSSREMEEEIQKAVKDGARELHIIADGQHGIGGRLWPTNETVKVHVEGPVGQRLGSMGMLGTEIVINGSVSDDVGWINCGATITVLGNVTNGAHNAAAQGVLYVQGGGGARCDTMTKHNPMLPPPESWYFRDVGDTFAEFKAGGVAVVCGVAPRNKKNILGYRPCVGMVGGVIYFRGPIEGFSEVDVKLLDLTEVDQQWITERMGRFLQAIERTSYYEALTTFPGLWQKLIPYTPQERAKRQPMKMSIAKFRDDIWEKGVGKGGIFAPYLSHPQTVLPYITTGNDRRYKPVWKNDQYAPPCQAGCPSGIPTQRRAQLIRSGNLHEAIELILQYSPLPATVCGEICPNLCMSACTRGRVDMPLDIKNLGKVGFDVPAPKRAPDTGKKVAVIGGGPGGLSAAWQLALKGHSVNLYEAHDKLGGKLELCIPRERLPQDVLLHEIGRFKEIGINIHLSSIVNRDKFNEIYANHDIVVLASGAHKPRKLNIPGADDVVTAYDFLTGINTGKAPDLNGKQVVIVGAGNVGMDVAAQAFHCGASGVTAVDIQKPAAFGKELEIAKALGTEVIWPKFTDKYVKEERKLYFKDGSSLETDIIVMSIGDMPLTDFLSETVHTNKQGWIEADEVGHTSDPKVYALGDAIKLGLVTDAIGNGRKTAEAVHALLSGSSYYRPQPKMAIPYEKIKEAYYDTCRREPFSATNEANRCMSCASCRDCHLCELSCYWQAITRVELENNAYEYRVDESICIGCGFCAGVCPCGIWEMLDNK